MSSLTWTVNYKVTEEEVLDVLSNCVDANTLDDNLVMQLVDRIFNLPDDIALLPACSDLISFSRKVDEWLEDENLGSYYECDEAIEDLIKELDSHAQPDKVIDLHTELKIRLLTEVLQSLLAYYDLEPFRVMLTTLKKEIRGQTD